jgi:hypothetical protein
MLRAAIRTSFVMALASMALAAPARAQASPDLTVYSPFIFDTAKSDDLVRFSWSPNNGQDFYRIVFSQYRTFGWEASPYQTPETVLNSTYVTPKEIGLSPGTWYWRVCFGWNTNPGVCYMDDDIRTLSVDGEPLFVSMANARATTKLAVRRRYHVRARVRRCARAYSSSVMCRADFWYRGRARFRVVQTYSDAESFYYRFR